MLAPTRELAIQITNELKKMQYHEDEFKIITVYGGVGIEGQTHQLRKGVDIFVGTTGRVLDHINRENIDLSDVKTLVLDEADQMFDMGFKPDVEKILDTLRSECKQKFQIALFSATMPNWVKDIARQHMNSDFRVVDLAQNLDNRTNMNVKHLAVFCPFHQRLEALSKILSVYGGSERIIVFT